MKLRKSRTYGNLINTIQQRFLPHRSSEDILVEIQKEGRIPDDEETLGESLSDEDVVLVFLE